MNISSVVLKGVGHAKLFLKKYAPDILAGVGIVGVGVGTVLACKATLKADTIVKETNEVINDISGKVGAKCEDGSEYSDEDLKNDISILKRHRNIQLVKNYLMSVLILAGSVVSIGFGHKILNDRYKGMIYAYNGAMAAYNELQKRVLEKYKEEGQQLIEQKTPPEELKNDSSDGLKVTGLPAKPLAILFDETSSEFTKDNGLNAAVLNSTINWANWKLHRDGYLFVNDVLERLGVQKIPEGNILGWVDDTVNGGSGYIDFGFQVEDFIQRCMLHEYDTCSAMGIMMYFTTDGNILDVLEDGTPWAQGANYIYKLPND